MQWEYTTELILKSDYPSFDKKIDTTLNDYGRNGWEVISTIPQYTQYGSITGVYIILKRQKR